MKTYLKESYTELVHKVTWPTWSELSEQRRAGMVAYGYRPLIVALMDFSFSNIMEEFYKLLFK